MLVKIDESGSDHQPAGMNNAPPAQHLRRDADNPAVADTDVAYGIESGLWIHNAPAFDHEIVLLCGVLLCGHGGGREQ